VFEPGRADVRAKDTDLVDQAELAKADSDYDWITQDPTPAGTRSTLMERTHKPTGTSRLGLIGRLRRPPPPITPLSMLSPKICQVTTQAEILMVKEMRRITNGRGL